MSDKEDEGGIIDFLFKVIFTIILVYVASYFSGYHQMFMGVFGGLFEPIKPILQRVDEYLRILAQLMGLGH